MIQADPTIFIHASIVIISTGAWLASMILLALSARKVITKISEES